MRLTSSRNAGRRPRHPGGGAGPGCGGAGPGRGKARTCVSSWGRRAGQGCLPGPASRNVHGHELFGHTEYHPGHGWLSRTICSARRCHDATSSSRHAPNPPIDDLDDWAPPPERLGGRSRCGLAAFRLRDGRCPRCAGLSAALSGRWDRPAATSGSAAGGDGPGARNQLKVHAVAGSGFFS